VARLFVPTAVDVAGVPGLVLFALVGLVALALFAWEVSERLHLVARGRPDVRFDHLGARLRTVLVNVFGQRRLLNDPYSGPMHFVIFWGFLVLLVGNLNFLVAPFLGRVLVPWLGGGGVYPVFALSQDLAEDLVIVAVLAAWYKRWVMRPERLEQNASAVALLVMIFVLMATDLVMGGLRIALAPTRDALWSPGARLIGLALAGIAPAWGRALYAAMFALHDLAFFAILIEIPRSKHFHIALAPVNVLARDGRPKGGRIAPIRFDDDQLDHFGAGRYEDLSWKHLLDTFTCTECGRCQDACPAWASGKPLSPKRLMIDLRDHVMASAGVPADERPPLAGGVISEEVLWACTTCRACEEACPVFNEHVPDIVEMRRYLVLTEAAVPTEAQGFFNNLEKAQNPWGRDPFDRGAWLGDLGVPTVAEVDGQLDYLYWIGCAGAYDDRARKVTEAVVRILQRMGTRFAILGPEEKCNGEAARRLGNEYLFQTLRDENRERIRAARPRRILVTCPHCFNTLKHEYGLDDVDVVHHAVFLEEMVAAGALPLKPTAAGRKVTYHDPCYLGRYNDVYDEPRALIGAVGATAVEMPRHRERGLCCGAGGGRMWLEEDRHQRVNAIRVAEALATGADTIATACPFCLVMLKDGLNERGEERVEARDIAELVVESLDLDAR
jgi:Fe-S oxidoreductase